MRILSYLHRNLTEDLPLSPSTEVAFRESEKRRAQNGRPEEFDVVVIGAGIGGLACAAMLARKGRRVLVLDQQRAVGGSCTIFRRNGFRFDIGLHYLGECGPGERLRRMLEHCGVTDIEFLPMSKEYDVINLPDTQFVVPTSKDEYKSRLIERFPEEQQGIERYFRFLDQVKQISGITSRKKFSEKLWLVAKNPLALRYARNGTAGEVVDSCTSNPELKAILLSRNTTYAVAPGRVAALLDAGLRNHFFVSGGWYPRGGGKAISEALADSITREGGQIRLRCAVQKVLLIKKKASGVTYLDKNGKEHVALAPVVLSNADVKKTLFELVGRQHIPRSYYSKINSFEMSTPFFVAFLGLDLSSSELPYKNANQWVLGDLDVDAEYQAIDQGKMSKNPSLYISTSALKDPLSQLRKNKTKSDKVTLEMIMLTPGNPRFWGVDQESVRNGSYSTNPLYKKRKEAILELCLKQAERVIPSIHKHVAFAETASPLTHHRYIRSTCGSPYGFASTPSQFFKKRPGPTTPIPGLYLCGMNTQSAHGVFGVLMSAVYAADSILKQNTKPELLKCSS